MGYFEDLLKEGYFISIIKGVYQGVTFTEYRVQKEQDDSRSTIACYLNLSGFREVRKKYTFPIATQIREVHYLDKPDTFLFHTQIKETLKLTFHE